MEKDFLRRLLQELGAEENDVVYIDDLIVKVDGSASTTSKLPFQTWKDFGWKNVASALSDLRVKFAEPLLMLVSVTAPFMDVAEEIIEGVKEAARRFSLRYAGGDLNEGIEAVVDVVMVGRAPAKIGRVPNPGDLLITIPHFGYTSIAYKFWPAAAHPTVKRGVEMLKRPEPIWPLPPLECVTASMDSSDGLADVLWTMAKGVDIVVTQLPTTDDVEAFAEDRQLDLEELVFNGGEEYLPVFAIRPNCEVRPPYVAFAEVRPGQGNVWWRDKPLPWRGWSYFRRG